MSAEPAGNQPVAAVPAEELARAGIYRLLANLLAHPADQWMLGMMASLRTDDGAVGAALGAVGAKARDGDAEAIGREYHDLFIGLVEGEVVPYASYYLTGFLHEKPLARLRRDMAGLGVARAGAVAEPEDSIAGLCDIMGGLITGTFGEAAPLTVQKTFFDDHLAPWAPRFFADLEAADSADFYRPVGALGRQFMALETTAFGLAPSAAADRAIGETIRQ
ncbi:MAG: molecular chaperone TorD family protein [Alphaproteobacteria bacterium]|nr:molecular chaperone TorD family protein [Alphaproteobacteria bacterium]